MRRMALIGRQNSFTIAISQALRERGWSVDELGDVSSREALATFFDDHQLIVHAHHPESLLERRAFVSMTEQQWIATTERALQTAVWVAQAGFDPLQKAGGAGRLVFVVSTVGMAGAPELVPLGAVGEGIRAFAKSLAKQWGKHGITVNALAVSPELLIGGDAGMRAAESVALAVPALGRAGDPSKDIAPVIDVLAGADTAFVTGSTLILDGGVWMAL